MKKIFSLLLIVIMLFGAVSCGKKVPDDTPGDSSSPAESTDNVDAGGTTKAATEAETSGHMVEEGTGFEFKATEIALPADGEKLTYSPALLLYSGDDGKKMEALSSERHGKTITFYTSETDYFFDSIGMTILTSSGEIFISLNGKKTEDGTYKYEIDRFDGSPDPNDKTLELTPKEFKDYLGDSFDPTKNYYSILYVNVYMSSKD